MTDDDDPISPRKIGAHLIALIGLTAGSCGVEMIKKYVELPFLVLAMLTLLELGMFII